MVSKYNASSEFVSYEYNELLIFWPDETGVTGYRWKLELPSEPDSTVEITDVDKLYTFTQVEEVNGEYRAVGPVPDHNDPDSTVWEEL